MMATCVGITVPVGDDELRPREFSHCPRLSEATAVLQIVKMAFCYPSLVPLH